MLLLITSFKILGIYEMFSSKELILEENTDEKTSQEKMIEKAQSIIDYFKLTGEEFSVILHGEARVIVYRVW